MTTITAAATFPVASPFNTTPSYSGTFIPSIWSSKLNAKFYAASVYGDIANTDWEGEIKGMGDKIVINNPPSITVSDYTVGSGLTYQVPTPDTIELTIDKGKAFAFQINNVLDYQAKPELLDMFSADAAEQMRTAIDSTVLYHTFNQGAAANKGATAGAKSASYDLGTDDTPVTLTAANVLQKILELASVLDEQNVPDSDRYVVIDPYTRTLLLQSNLAQAQFMGDATSAVRNGLIGTIDRFKIYVSNQLPKAILATNSPWLSGDGSENSVTSTGDVKRRAIVAGHKSAITFASQITEMETVPNPTDFGKYVRSLNVFGYKMVKPEGFALMVVA